MHLLPFLSIGLLALFPGPFVRLRDDLARDGIDVDLVDTGFPCNLDVVRVDQMPMLPLEFFRSHGSVLYLAERSRACLRLFDFGFSNERRIVRREARSREYATEDHG